MGGRGSVAYPLSYRQGAELRQERGGPVDHAPMQRWGVPYRPLLAAAWQRRQRSVGRSWRMEVCQTQPVKMPWCPLRRFA